jgi:UDP:flavonoid glycosyltransferase YjiC (YdhE family)
MLVGWNEAARVRSLPAGMLAAAYVPHRLVFPRAAAVVHHGGIGTTAQGLRAGVPTLVVPHAHDQPDNAFRVEQLGVARWIDARRYTADRASQAIGSLLGDRTYAERARAVAEMVRAEHGAHTASELILKLS